MTQHIEKGTNYAYTVERMKEINFRSLRSVSVEFTKRLPVELSSELYTNIQHGVCQLQSEPELNMYIHALGLMHEAKLQYAFEHLSDDFIRHQTIDIIDYGCGQAIGTICYADFLHKNGFSQQVRRVILIEPSEIALKRASLHVSCFFPQAEIVTCLKGFDDLKEDDLCVDEETPTLHIFSNVIDLADDYFNLERFVGLINQCSIGDNHYLCIEPHFDYEEKDKRLERFIGLLDAETYYCKTFPKGTFVEGRDWTCQVALCESESTRTTTTISSPFGLKVKALIKKRAEYIKNCKIKNVEYSITDDEGIVVSFTLATPIEYIHNDGEYRFLMGKTDIVKASIYSIAEALQEDEEFCWLGGTILEDFQIIKKVLKGATVNILQQNIAEEENYVPLFNTSDSNNKIDAVYMIDSYVPVNHCVKFMLSKEGEEVANKVAEIQLGIIKDSNITLLKELASSADREKRYKIALKYYKLAAEANNIEAQYKLGHYYYYGIGINSDLSEAVKWWCKAAEQGYANAQCSLGYCLYMGKGITQNLAEAVEWYRKAAEQGNAVAQHNIGVCYEKGRGVGKDETEAVKWYYKAAKQGYANAQCSLGICYDLGRGVNKDEIEAVRWYRKAADQGDMIAQTNLGVCYKFGQGVLKDEVEAVKWYRKAAEQGCANAQYKLASCCKEGEGVVRNDSEAIKWYIKAAEQGDEAAESQLVSLSIEEINLIRYNNDSSLYGLYGHGRKYEIDNNRVNWCIKVAQYGYAKAQSRLALYYWTKKDYREAAKWYHEAAKQGDVIAQVNLAYCYMVGQGCDKDIFKAAKWYHVAAKRGNAYAQYILAQCYEKGEGVAQNDEEAITWYLKSAQQGEERAKKALLRSNSDVAEIGTDWLLRVAERGFLEAQYKLALRYEQGDGVEQSYEEAAKWYLKSAEQDCGAAKCKLADFYALGRGVEKSIEEAISWIDKWGGDCGCECKEFCISNYLKKKDKKGGKLYSLGSFFYYGKRTAQSYEEAIMWWKMAADVNNSNAAYMLGLCYEEGHGVGQSHEEAVMWWKRAADANNSNAKYKLGLCYAEGDGLEQSYEKAFGLFIEVAKSGFNIEAENIVGTYYEKGLGIEQSYEEAVKWYAMAAEQKNKEAMCNLGNCYRYGRGVKRSYNEAVKWYKESGTKDAQTALNEIYSKNLLRRWLKIIQFKFGILK